MSVHTQSSASKFDELVAEVKACAKCARMCDSQRVIGRSSGPLNAAILFIGEAPGRLGADDSLVPFHGDKSGDNFEELMSQVGLSRHDAFITNAVLCNPKDERGNNAPPAKHEVENCATYLRNQIDLINPRIVVTLGAVALQSTRMISDHSLTLSKHVRTKHDWYGRILIPLYHPGQRAMLHRSFHNQLSDYKFVFDALRDVHGKRKSRPRAGSGKVYDIAKLFLQTRGSLTYFSLHKLFYLAEVEYFRRKGVRLTDSYIIRQKDGPYAVELHLRQLEKRLGVRKKFNGTSIILESSRDLFSNSETALKSDELEVIMWCIEKYGAMSDFELKRVAYTSVPMRSILKYEKKFRLNMFNSPIDFTSIAARS